MRNLKKIKRVFILGKPFKVIFCKERTGDLYDLERKRYYVGRILMEEQRMSIADHLALEETFETIFHEAFHAADDLVGSDSEELYVKRMSAYLTAILLDNFKITPKQEIL